MARGLLFTVCQPWRHLCPQFVPRLPFPNLPFAPTASRRLASLFGDHGQRISRDLVKAIDVEWAKLDLEAGVPAPIPDKRWLYDGDQFRGFDAFAAKLAKDWIIPGR